MENNETVNELKVNGNEFDPQLQEKLKQQKEFEAMRAYQCQAEIQGYHTGYSAPREYLHNFLLQAQSAGADVGRYIDDEIRLLLTELKR